MHKQAIAAGAAGLALVGLLGAEHLRVRSNLESSTRITQSLRDELETLRKQNQEFVGRESAERTRVERLSAQLNTERTGGSLHTNRQNQLKRMVEEAERALASQNRKVAELEARLKESEQRMSRQQRASQNLENQTRSAKANPGMTPEYLRIVENEWMTAVARTEELRKDLDKTLDELSGQNQERTKLRNDTATMHYNLAVILTEQQNYPAAILEYQKVLEIRPEDADAHYNLGVLYDDYLKNHEKALEHYRRYVKAAPDSPEAQKVRQWIKDKEFDNTFKFKL